MGVHMHSDGPMLDGRGVRILGQASRDIEREIAIFAEDQDQMRLARVLKNPTGYYQSQIRRHQAGGYWQVDDSQVAYGPWLESGKNRHRTRFKGYFMFRRAAQITNRRASAIADRVLRRYIGRLG